MDFPRGYRWELGGEFRAQQESFASLLMVLISATALVFLLLGFQFRSLALPLLIFLSQPISLASALGALWITGTPLNVSSFMGAILLIGLDVKNGIILIEYIGQLRAEGSSLREALIHAGRIRFRPILMTSLATILGLLPLAFGFGPGAQMQQPLAIAVIGGLTVNMLVTRLLIPVGYLCSAGGTPITTSPRPPQRLPLQGGQIANAAAGQVEHGRQFLLAEGGLLAGPLHLDKPAGTGHHHVHVDVRREVLLVAEIQQGLAIDHAHAHGGHAVAKRPGAGGQVLGDRLQGIDQGQKTARDAQRAGAAVGFQHVAIDGHRPLADGLQVDHGAEAAADQALNLRRPPVQIRAPLAPLAGLVLPGNMLYSAVSQPRPWPLSQGGTSASTAAQQSTVVRPA